MGPEDPMGVAGSDQGDDAVEAEASAPSVNEPGAETETETETGTADADADAGTTATASSAEAAVIQSLRQRGAANWNPVRFRFIEALALRAASRQGAVRRLLDDTLAQALSAYEAGWLSALRDIRPRVDSTAARLPESAAALESLHAAGDLGGLNALIARLERQAGRRGEALADLVRRLQASASSGDASTAIMSTAPAPASAHAGEPATATPDATHDASSQELKTLRYFRGDWSRLHVDRRMNQSETQVPAHAGPLNSQVLALRALQQMRDLAPGYLARFMTYLDTLLWLDQASQPPAPPPKESPRAERKPKEKTVRRKPE